MPDPDQTPELWRINKKRWQEEYQQGVTTVESRPGWITLDTGDACNLHCVHCPRENPGGGFVEHNADQSLVDQLRDSLPYLERLTLYGLGEPLLSDLFWRIVEDERTKRIPQIDVNTNGTLLTPRNVERLLSSNLNFLKISLDGATPETFRKIRGADLGKILASPAAAPPETGARPNRFPGVGLHDADGREHPGVADDGRPRRQPGADALWAQHLSMRSDELQDKWRLTRNGWTFVYNEQHLSNAPGLSNRKVRKAQQRAKSLGFNFELDPELWLRQPNATTSAQPAPSATRRPKDTSRRPISECHEPWEWLFVAPLGGARPCCFASREIGNVRQQTVDQIWNGPTMVRLRGAIRDGYVDRVCRNAGCWFVRETERAFGVDAYDYRCEIDTQVNVRKDGRKDHCVDGWSEPEDWGVWSEGEVATLRLDLPEKPSGDLQLDFLCRAVGHERFPSSFVRVRVNGCDVERWEFRYPDSTEYSVWRTIDVRFGLIETRRLEVRFVIERPLSPRLWGRDDGRLLGVGLSALKIRRAATIHERKTEDQRLDGAATAR